MKKYLFLIVITLFLLGLDNANAYKEYKTGDEVIYNGDKYYVMYDSDILTNYVVLLKDDVLTYDQVKKYEVEYNTTDGEYPYYLSDTCNSLEYSGCNADYNSSSIKKIIDGWSNEFGNDLIEVNGYKARIINTNDLTNVLKYQIEVTEWYKNYLKTSNTPSWVNTNNDKAYWTTDNSDISLLSLPGSVIVTYTTSYIRPVINLNKCALNDSDKKCQKKEEVINDNNVDNSYSPYKHYNIGDEIIYNNELYYVIENSNSSNNYVTILKDKPLTVEELSNYGKDNSGDMFINKYFKKEIDNQIYEFDDNIGGIAYITRTYCGDKNNLSVYDGSSHTYNQYEIGYCTTEYDASNVSKVINKWALNFDSDLVKVNGYKAFLIDYSILDDINNFDWSKSNKYTYWTRTTKGSYQIYSVSANGLEVNNIFSKNAVRPAINLNKCSIELDNPNCNNTVLTKTCSTENVNRYKEYKFGETINYRGDNYYVLENSGNDKNYVTLLKNNSLTLNDLPNYKDTILNNMKLSNNLGYITYSCDNNVCSTNYDSSNIKKVIDNWMKISLNEDELVSINGYKARIISKEDLIDNLGYEESETGSGINVHRTSATPSIFPRIGIWTMYPDSDSRLMYIYGDSVNTARELSDYNVIMPVINVKKEIINLDEYPLGQEITYNNDQYYIISYDSPDKNYVTLLRSKPFTQGEITMYSTDNSVFSSPYYISDTCNSGTNISGCSSDFKNSEVKKILDTWSSEFNNDLVEVEGYKIRIPSKYDFIYNLSYDMDNFHATSYIYCKSNDTPSWVNNGYPYWSMEIYEDSNYLVHQNMSNGCLEVYKMPYGIQENSFQSSSIRPVINLNKCAIGGCYETEKCSEPESSSISETIVEVAKTLKNIPKIILVICGLLVITGSAFIIYNYLKSKKERK